MSGGDRPTIRPSCDDDVAAIAAIYAHHVLHGVGTFEEVAPSTEEIGRRRAAQGVPVSQLIWAIALTKENLMEFLARESSMDKPIEICGEMEVLQLLEQFFDRAIYYAALGYERSRAVHGAAAD
jgi:hypothetical protein